DDVPAEGVGRQALVDRIVTVAQRLRQDDVVMSVLHSAPDLAMVYIAERLGTSQQILLDAVAGEIKLAQEEG
ncbi:TetR/AcrR family transcriptional regulator, partial [Mycolicibacterium elephantis]